MNIRNQIFPMSAFLAAAFLFFALFAQPFQQEAHGADKPELGKDAPEFMGRTIDKKLVKLKALRGKLVLVDFWATWCPPCRGEIPHLQEAHKKWSKKGLEIVSVNIDEDTDTIQKFLAKMPMPWTHIKDNGGKIGALYRVTSIPAPFLIDPKGKLIAEGSMLRGELLEKVLEKYFELAQKNEVSLKQE